MKIALYAVSRIRDVPNHSRKPDFDDSAERSLFVTRLWKVLSFDPRSAMLIYRKFILGETYSELALVLCLSRERVRQMVREAIHLAAHRLVFKHEPSNFPNY